MQLGEFVLRPADLVVREDFSLGPLRVSPAVRTIKGPAGEVHVEPLIMNVFLQLVDANGQVVTRNHLFDECWGGVNVGDESLNRAITMVRRIAVETCPGAFRIESIPRTGYRLLVDGLPQGQDAKFSAAHLSGPTDARHSAGKSSRGIRPLAIAIAGMALMAVAGVTGYFVLGGAKPDRTTISIVGSSAGGAGSDYASSIAAEMAPVLAARAEDASILDPAAGNGAKTDFRLRVAITRNETSSDGTLALTSRYESGIIWSRNWTATDLSAVDLKQQMSFVASIAMLCALEGNKGGLGNRKGALGFYVEACARDYDSDSSEDELINLLTKTIERAPDFAPASALLAVIYSRRIGQLRRDLEAVPIDLLKKSQNAIENARKIDPNSARTFLAEGLAQGTPTRALPFMDRAADADPFDPLVRYYRAPALMSVGRMADAIGDARKSVELSPPSPEIRAGLIITLMDSGRSNEARAELAKAENLWSNSPDIRAAKFWYEFVHGDPLIARNILHSNLAIDDRKIEALGQVISAKIDPRPANVDLVLVELWRAREKQPQLGILYFYVLSLSNRFDEIFKLLAEPGFRSRLTSFALFAPENGPVRADLRFMKIAADYGLISYWRSSGKWPDFCADRGLPYDCKLEAAKYK